MPNFKQDILAQAAGEPIQGAPPDNAGRRLTFCGATR